MSADDAGEVPPAGPVSPEWLRASVSLPEALEVFAEADTLQELADLAHRFAQLHDRVLPEAHLKSCGGDFIGAAHQLPAGEHREAFRVWYEQRYSKSHDVERKLQRGELFAFGSPENLVNDPKWIPTRACAAWCEIRGDTLAVHGGIVFFGVRVVMAAQWRATVASQFVPAAEEQEAASHPQSGEASPAVMTETGTVSEAHPSPALDRLPASSRHDQAEQVTEFAEAHPGWGPDRIFAELKKNHAFKLSRRRIRQLVPAGTPGPRAKRPSVKSRGASDA